MVLSTIGPHTVIPYLNFALGKGIGNSISHEPEAAVGLETIAQPIANEDEYTDSVNGSSNYGTVSSHSGSLDDSLELKDEKSADFPNDLDVKKEDPCDLSQHSNSSEKSTSRLPTYCYGGISDRIGEAVGCWLTRWGVDMLHLEEECQHDNSQASPASPTTRKRASTLPMQLGISAKLEAHGTEIEEEAPNVPLIWRRGGLDPNWARIVLSSDTLFVKGEKERYNMARSVVEMRRKVGVIQEEESEWTSLFDKGIYYTNMVCFVVFL